MVSHNENNAIYVTCPKSSYAIELSNNKSRYFSEVAERYKNEAKEFRDSAMYYAEQNSDLTKGYVDSIETALRNLIATKQDSGNYVLDEDIPTKLSELENDSMYLTSVPTATESDLGLVMPDSDTICIDENGIISTDFSSVISMFSDVLSKKQISNCVLKIPQRIKYTLENGVLTVKEGSVLIFPYGTEDLSSSYTEGETFLNSYKIVNSQYSDGKFFVWAELQDDLTLTLNWNTANSQMMLFGGATLGRNTLDKCISGNTNTEMSGSAHFWYDTTANSVKSVKANGTAEELNCSLPLLIFVAAGNNTSDVSSVSQVFNGFGYIGGKAWVDMGVNVLGANGRNADGTLNNVEFTTDTLLFTSANINNNVKNYLILSNSNGEITFSCNAVATTNFDKKRNFILSTDGTEVCGAVVIALSESTGGLVTSFKANKCFRALDDNISHISETYVNGTSGYRIWSDGYCEQWGRIACSSAEAEQTISFTKTFTNTDYNLLITGNSSYTSTSQVMVARLGMYKSKSDSSFVMLTYRNAYMDFYDWKASGYLANGQY